MKRSCVVYVFALLAVPGVGCLALQTGSPDGGAAASDAGTPATSDGAPAVQGAGCATDTATGVTLCTAISLCPTLAIDHEIFPNCGFRIRGGVIDLECFCNGEVCPMGAPATCTQAKQLMDSQTELSICQQVNDGRCTSGVAPAPSTTGATGTCDRECQSKCAGDPSCVTMCGC